MSVVIFWESASDKYPKKKGVVGGALWHQFIVNAKAGNGVAYFIECANAEQGRAIIKEGKHTASSKHRNVFYYGDAAKNAVENYS